MKIQVSKLVRDRLDKKVTDALTDRVGICVIHLADLMHILSIVDRMDMRIRELKDFRERDDIVEAYNLLSEFLHEHPEHDQADSRVFDAAEILEKKLLK